MKTFKTALAVITAALLPLALLASPSSAALGVDDATAPTGSLKLDESGRQRDRGQPRRSRRDSRSGSTANFTGGVRNVTFYKVVGGTHGRPSVPTTANANGNAYLNYTIAAGAQDIYAEDVDDEETETDTYTGEAAPPPARHARRRRRPPARPGRRTSRPGQRPVHQARRSSGSAPRRRTRRTEPRAASIRTSKPEGLPGPWKTIATGTQNANGDSTFTPSRTSRVEHKYRAISGDEPRRTRSQFAPPLGGRTTRTASHRLVGGVLQHQRGPRVDTRDPLLRGRVRDDRQHEGRPEPVHADGSGCGKHLKQSVMKGRGNYSWSFNRSRTRSSSARRPTCAAWARARSTRCLPGLRQVVPAQRLAGYVGSKLDDMAWTPKSEPVDFYLNGKYLGNYLLVERIAIAGTRSSMHTRAPVKCIQQPRNIHELNGATTEQRRPVHDRRLRPRVGLPQGCRLQRVLGSDSGYVGVKDPENDYGRTGSSTATATTRARASARQQKTYIKQLPQQGRQLAAVHGPRDGRSTSTRPRRSTTTSRWST